MGLGKLAGKRKRIRDGDFEVNAQSSTRQCELEVKETKTNGTPEVRSWRKQKTNGFRQLVNSLFASAAPVMVVIVLILSLIHI